MYLLSNKTNLLGKKLLTITFIVIALLSKAQESVTVTATVFPPYSTSFSYYIDNPNKIQVTFLNTTSQPLDVYAQGRLTGDNGVEIRTDPSYHPSLPITLYPGIPFHLTQDNIGNIFSANHLIYEGTSQSELLSMGGLPEGNYQFCFSVYDFGNGNLLSNEDMGCSNMIIIQYVDPPVILNPVCGDSIISTDPQNILVSWTAAVGGGPNIRYRFIMTEMMPGTRDPNDAMASASPPYFLEQDVAIPQILIGPAAPPLIPGRSYAFIVQAYDPNNEVIFNNNGNSEVCWFNYKTIDNGIMPDTSLNIGDSTSLPGMLNGVAVSINGKIHYRYVEDNKTGPVAYESFDLVDMFVLKKPDGEYINIYDMGMNDFDPNTQVTYDFVDENGQPIPPDDIKFNSGYLNAGQGVNIAKDGSINVANGVTDKDGNFHMLLVIPSGSYYGLLHKNVTAQLISSTTHIDATAGGGVHTSTSTSTSTLGNGDLYRVLRVILHDNDIFGHPSEPIIPDSNSVTITCNNLESLVRTYNIDVFVEGQYTRRGDGSTTGDLPLAGMYGKLVRDNTVLPSCFPNDEGSSEPLSPNASSTPLVTVIGEAVTNGEGILRFSKIVQFERKLSGNTSGQATQRMTYYIKPTETGEANYSTASSYSIDLPDAPDNLFSTVNDNNWPIPTVTETVIVQALNPKVLGIVQDAKNKIPIENALIFLYGYDNQGNQADFQWVFSQSNGHYEFNNLDPYLSYRMEAGKYGYELGKHDVFSFKPMGTGVKEYYEFDLDPLSGVYGTIVNEEGEGIPVHIYLDGGYQFAFTPAINFLHFPNFSYLPTKFHVDVPENTIHMIVDADNEEYADWDTTFTVQGKFIKLPKPIVLKKESRKLELTVQSPVGRWGFMVAPLADARVVIEGVSDTLLTDGNGKIDYRFNSSSSANNFTVTVLSPLGMSYQTRHLSMNIPVSSSYVKYTVIMEKGSNVEGYVYDDNGQPVKDALIRWDNGSGSSEFTVKSNAQGHYQLNGLPKNRNLEFTASKPASQYIGQTKSKMVIAGSNSLNFTLQNYSGMDITHLLGFEMAVDSLVESNGKTFIWGYLYNLPSNTDFATADAGQQIPFSEVSIIPKQSGGTPVAYPENGQLLSNLNQFNLKALGFNAYTRSSTGLTVQEVSYSTSPGPKKGGFGGYSGSVTGTVKGKMYLNPVSFQTSKFILNEPPQLFAHQSDGTDTPDVYSITSKGISVLLYHSMKVYGKDKKALSFKVYDFDATATPSGSFVESDTLSLDTHLHTNLQNSTPTDLNIPIGNLKITKNKIIPVYGKTDLAIGLQDWTIQTRDWGFDKLGFSILHGNLDMQGMVVPFTDMKVKPESLYRGDFDFSNISILGIKKLAFTPDVKTFLSSQDSYWRFEIFPADDQTYCASINHLPALSATDKIIIEKVVLFSRMSHGSYYKLPEQHPWLNVYNTMKFKPAQLYVYSDMFSLSGVFDPEIPNTDQQYYSSRIKYRNGGNNLSFEYEPFNFSVQANACLMEFLNQANDERQTLTSSGFLAKGTISERPMFSFNMELTKTPAEHVTTATLKPTGQKWNFSKGKTLHNLRGSMTALPANWPVFAFTGDVKKEEFNGADGPMKFIVNGELTGDPDNSQIKLDKVETPFGDMNFTFDYSVPSIVGNLNFDKKIGTAQVKGGIQMVLDNQGWYLLGGGNMKFPNPYFQEGMAGIVFGNYPVTDNIKTGFLSYSGVQFPMILFPTKINGFMFAGTVVMQPSPIPDVDVDVGVASVEFNVDVGASLGMGADFDKANFLALTDVYLYAFFKVSAMGVVSGSIDGLAYAGALGMINLNTGSFVATGNAGLKMSGQIDVAGETILSGEFGYGINITVTHKPDDVSFSIE